MFQFDSFVSINKQIISQFYLFFDASFAYMFSIVGLGEKKALSL